MRQPLNVLDDLRIDSPCPVAWAEMAGDDRVRHCSRCDQPVYDLSALTAAEAVELVTTSSGCVRVYRWPDGRVVTRDRRPRRAARRVALAVASWLGFAVVAGCRDESRCAQGKIAMPPAAAQPPGAPPIDRAPAPGPE